MIIFVHLFFKRRTFPVWLVGQYRLVETRFDGVDKFGREGWPCISSWERTKEFFFVGIPYPIWWAWKLIVDDVIQIGRFQGFEVVVLGVVTWVKRLKWHVLNTNFVDFWGEKMPIFETKTQKWRSRGRWRTLDIQLNKIVKLGEMIRTNAVRCSRLIMMFKNVVTLSVRYFLNPWETGEVCTF